MKKIVLYLKVAVISALAIFLGILAKGKSDDLAELKTKKKALEKKRKLYEKADVDTRRKEEKLKEEIDEIDRELEEDIPAPTSGDDAADRLSNLMGWERDSAD